MLSVRVVLAPLLALVLAGCLSVPRAVEGLPGTEPWFALPLRGFLAEGRAEPEAIAVCASADCAQRLAVGVIRLTGAEARAALALLRDPAPLKRALEARDAAETDARRRAIRTLVTVARLPGDRPGFAMSLARADGARSPAYIVALGEALGREAEGTVRVVLAAGLDADAVEAAARTAAAGHSRAAAP